MGKFKIILVSSISLDASATPTAADQYKREQYNHAICCLPPYAQNSTAWQDASSNRLSLALMYLTIPTRAPARHSIEFRLAIRLFVRNSSKSNTIQLGSYFGLPPAENCSDSSTKSMSAVGRYRLHAMEPISSMCASGHLERTARCRSMVIRRRMFFSIWVGLMKVYKLTISTCSLIN